MNVAEEQMEREGPMVAPYRKQLGGIVDQIVCGDTVITSSSSFQSLSPDVMLYPSHPKSSPTSILKNASSGFLSTDTDTEGTDEFNEGTANRLKLTQTQLREKQPLLTNDSIDIKYSCNTGEHVSFDSGSDHESSDHDTPPATHQPPPGLPAAPSFLPMYTSTRLFQRVAKIILPQSPASTWIGFFALLLVTCANFVLSPMRDAVALGIGVKHIPKLTLASTLLAVISSVPIGWLFEAPDPKRRQLWKRMGLTRGETQGTSLALFYRCFALSILSYAVGFKIVKWYPSFLDGVVEGAQNGWISSLLSLIGQIMYVAFFLVVHLMKLHSLSLVWGVTTEAMEYEDSAKMRNNDTTNSRTRLQRLAFVGFGGTVGGILGSVIASSMAYVLSMSGLMVVAAVLLELSAELSIELGRIMQKHWEEQTHFTSSNDLTSLDASMKRSSSLGSMKRVASGNSIHKDLNKLPSLSEQGGGLNKAITKEPTIEEQVNDSSFSQRLLRGVTTILRSRLLMAIFTYNALYASTSVLLSFQRAALVANRNATSSTESDTAFLAQINMASSIAIFALQATGVGAFIAHLCGPRGTLVVMPTVRLLGVLCLCWWHRQSEGKPPNLIVFLLLDECTRVMNLAVAKPVRESLWRGLSNEARYEAKPIVDTLANRWGGGSAAFLVSLMDKMLDVFGFGTLQPDGSRTVLGFPPVLFLCMVISAWWAMVSADLGQIRRRIDVELKKHQ